MWAVDEVGERATRACREWVWEPEEATSVRKWQKGWRVSQE